MQFTDVQLLLLSPPPLLPCWHAAPLSVWINVWALRANRVLSTSVCPPHIPAEVMAAWQPGRWRLQDAQTAWQKGLRVRESRQLHQDVWHQASTFECAHQTAHCNSFPRPHNASSTVAMFPSTYASCKPSLLAANCKLSDCCLDRAAVAFLRK